MNQETIDKIVSQSIDEISFARKYKAGKIKNWQKNESLYYGVKQPSTEARANVDLGRMQEFVHTLLSKIDEPLIFKFVKRKEAQLKRVQRLNALRQIDSFNDNWGIKDLVGKKQGIIYGRPVFSYYADSIDGGYRPHLDNVDVYDYLIDPSAGGIDMERADYMGNYGVVYTRKQLEEMAAEKKDKDYDKDVINNLLAGTGNNAEITQEEINKTVRAYGQSKTGQKELQSSDKFKFWRWFTTYKDKRYYLLMQETAGSCIRISKLTDLFTPTKEYLKGAWPFWSWAAFPDLTEFWTPSYCDYVREIFMAQNISVNQMLDNAEAVNKPQKVVNVEAIENLAELKYKKDGIIRTKNNIDANKAVQLLSVPSIQTPIMVFDVLERIQEKASGVTAGTKGVGDEERVGIYKGNIEQAADRFGLLNKSYAFGYRQFARLYEIGVRDNLTKKVAIDMIGPGGIETEQISRKDIFYKDDDFGVLVEASNAETMASEQTKMEKTAFLNSLAGNPLVNPKKVIEIRASTVGFTEDEIKELLDVSEFGNQELLSEAARDIESILDGEDIKPNANANTSYKQRLVSFMQDKEEDMTDEQFKKMEKYIKSLEPIIMRNMVRSLNAHAINLMNQPPMQGGAMPSGVQEPALQENVSQI